MEPEIGGKEMKLVIFAWDGMDWTAGIFLERLLWGGYGRFCCGLGWATARHNIVQIRSSFQPLTRYAANCQPSG